MHLTIRADGGSEIGFGHLVRTSAIAREVLDRGGNVTYATTTPRSVAHICPDGVQTTALPSRDNPAPFRGWLDETRPNAILVDAYPVDTNYQQIITEYAPLSLVADDTRHVICADMLVNGNLYAKDLTYEFVETPPEQYLGPSYALLREEIRTLSHQKIPRREHAERALVTMGGSDMTERTPTTIRAFDGFDIHVDAIVGPGFSAEQETEIHAAAGDVSADVTVTRDPDDLAERMFEADFAVSTSSSTTYELLAMGTPIVSIPVADNQEPIATALCERDAATVLEREAGEDAFRGAIEEYVTNPTLRRKRRNQGRELVDGRGTERVYAELLSLLDER